MCCLSTILIGESIAVVESCRGVGSGKWVDSAGRIVVAGGYK